MFETTVNFAYIHLARTTFSTLVPQIVTEDFLEKELEEEELEEAPGEGRLACNIAVCHAETSCMSAAPPPPAPPAPPINGAMAEEGEEEVPSGKIMCTPVRWVIWKAKN